jgi:hypothetical protein
MLSVINLRSHRLFLPVVTGKTNYVSSTRVYSFSVCHRDHEVFDIPCTVSVMN